MIKENLYELYVLGDHKTILVEITKYDFLARIIIKLLVDKKSYSIRFFYVVKGSIKFFIF